MLQSKKFMHLRHAVYSMEQNIWIKIISLKNSNMGVQKNRGFEKNFKICIPKISG